MPVAPASIEESSPKGPTVETSLVKCSGSLSGVGSTGKSVLRPVTEEEVRLPGEAEFADRPPLGYVAINRQMCLSGAIPTFNSFLEVLLRCLTISPFQLHPNSYAILQGLCVLFMRMLQRLPSFEEICYLCTFSSSKDHTSIVYIRGARNRRLIMDLSDSAHGFLNQYFYVQCPAGYYGIWRKAGETVNLHSP